MDILKSEVKQIRVKLNVPVARKLRYYKDVLAWSGVEIFSNFGLPSNRQTEIENYNDPKYKNGGITENLLDMLLEKKFMTLDEVKKGGNFTEKELKYLDRRFIISRDEDLRDTLVEMDETIPDYKKYIKRLIALHKQGKNLNEILDL